MINRILYLIFISSIFGGFQIFNFGNFGIQPIYIFMFLFLMYVFISFITGNLELHISSKVQITLPFLLIVVSSFSLSFLIGYGYQGYVIQFLKTYLHFLFLIFFSISLGLIILKPNTWKNVAKCWIILSFFVNIFGIYQLFARAFELPLAWIDMTNASLRSLSEGYEPYKQLSLQFKNFYRATSIFSEPSSLASFNLYVISFMIYPLFVNKFFNIFKNKFIINSAFLISLIALFVTFSLTGFVGLVLLIGGYLYSIKKLDISRIIFYFIATSLVLIIADYFIEEYFSISILDLFYQRISSILGLTNQGIVGESFGTRADNFFTSIKAWMNNPIIGVGLGQTKNFSEIGFSDFGVLHAFIETGLLGGFIFVLMIILIFTKFTFIIRHIDKESDEIIYISYLGYFISIILIFKNFVVANMFINWECWLFIGMCMSILNIINYDKGWKVESIHFFKKKPNLVQKGLK